MAHAGNLDNVWWHTLTSTVNTCTGESVLISGTAHVRFNEKGHGAAVSHISLHGTGTGSDGNEYVLNSHESYKADAAGFSDKQHVVLVSRGSAPNMHVTVTMSYPPFVFAMDADCAG